MRVNNKRIKGGWCWERNLLELIGVNDHMHLVHITSPMSHCFWVANTESYIGIASNV